MIKKKNKMIVVAQRKSDKKYLQSLENDVWVDNIKDAFEMTILEWETTKQSLSNSYNENELKVLIDYNKLKPTTREQKKELLEIIKSK